MEQKKPNCRREGPQRPDPSSGQAIVAMIIPFFIMNRGCPHRCLFCNEKLTAGNRPDRIEAQAFHQTVQASLASKRRRRGPVQIAFYGGTFTGMSNVEQFRLLDLAAPYLASGEVEGIRISTRPDEIDREGIALLKARGVRTVELGAQSLDDAVLLRSGRGHGAADTLRAIALLQAEGLETGLHLMAGLPGDSRAQFLQTIEKTIALRPATVRLHPTVVLADTPLAAEYRAERYRPLSLDEAVDWCREALRKLTGAGIPVIRLGLQTTAELETPGAVVAGPFHPAFGSLVEAALFLEMAGALLAAGAGMNAAEVQQPALFTVAPADLSGFQGHCRENLVRLKNRFPAAEIRVVTDPVLPRRSLTLTTESGYWQTDWSGRIAALSGEGLHAEGGRAKKEYLED
ncbi:MAG: radical SAM protein [Deltaproteobacteria bacterium]|nr:radical SAM protein [Deltaproteobacteria bacterium]